MPGRRVESDVVDIGEREFEPGEILPDPRVAYEAYGELDGQNAALICHDLTGSQHVAGHGTESGVSGQVRTWWGDIAGPGKAIDTNDHYVIYVNAPGSCYDTSGPTSEGSDGEPWDTGFPPVTVHDWTRVQCRLLNHSDVDRLHAVVGGSVGGMDALDWAMQFPDDVERLAVVAPAARPDSQCLGIDTVARRAIISGPNWNGDDYYGEERPPPDVGLGLVRQLGHLTYLSKDSMERKFGRHPADRGKRGDAFPSDFAAFSFPYRGVESYLDYQAEKFVEHFDANVYLYLMCATGDFDLSEGYESDAAALAAFEGEALPVSFIGDWYLTTEQPESLAGAFRRGDVSVIHHVAKSDRGHDAFPIESEKVGPSFVDFVDEGVTGRAVTDTAPDGGEPDKDEDFAPVHSSLFSR